MGTAELVEAEESKEERSEASRKKTILIQRSDLCGLALEGEIGAPLSFVLF